MTTSGSYANPDLLCETQWLAERLQRKDIRIVDMGPYEGYARAHIPGAVHPGPGDRSHYLKAPSDPLHVLPPEAFAELMGRLGIGNDTLVVAYDADGGHTAARLWWALAYYGHPRCKLLDGGFNTWVLEKRPVQIEQMQYHRTNFKPRVDEDLLCTLDQLRGEMLDRDDVVLWDVRTPAEYEGTETRGNKRAGHLRGARHLEWRELVTNDATRMFKSAGDMRNLLWEREITPNKQAVTYCQAGVRASLGAFLLKLLGYDRVAVYDGSWAEWGNRRETPIEGPGALKPRGRVKSTRKPATRRQKKAPRKRGAS